MKERINIQVDQWSRRRFPVPVRHTSGDRKQQFEVLAHVRVIKTLASTASGTKQNPPSVVQPAEQTEVKRETNSAKSAAPLFRGK